MSDSSGRRPMSDQGDDSERIYESSTVYQEDGNSVREESFADFDESTTRGSVIDSMAVRGAVVEPTPQVDDAADAEASHGQRLVDEQNTKSAELTRTEGANWVGQSADLGQHSLDYYKEHGEAALNERGKADAAQERAMDDLAAQEGRGSGSSNASGSTRSTGSAGAGGAAGSTGAAGQSPVMGSASTSGDPNAPIGETSSSSSPAGGTPRPGTPGATGVSGTGGLTPGGSSPSIINQIQIGFRVIDSNGDDIGTVRELKDADANAEITALTEEQASINTDAREPGLLGAFTANDGVDLEPRVEQPMHDELLRIGYIRIDTKGWFSHDRYASSKEIASVEGETVHLNVPKDQLVPRS